MNVEEEIVEFQKLDKQLQAVMTQRLQLEAQLTDVTNALRELEKVGDEEVYKLVGGILIKTNKAEAKKELESRRALLERGISKFKEEEESLKEKLTRLGKKLEQRLGKGG